MMRGVMADGPTFTLVDATDRTRRRLQHGAILAGILLLAATLGLLDPPERRLAAVGTAAAGLILLGAAARISQRWDAAYKGHAIRYVNNPLAGERLWIDGRLAGKGRIGIVSEIRATIAGGDGRGDVIVARSTAGLLTFQCRITAEPAAPADTAASGLTDAALLDEVRRRGLS
jgi:hypothetical protein